MLIKTNCLLCKGRLWCGENSCPLLSKIRIQAPLQKKMSENIFGPSPPNIFVGWKEYPEVSIGPMVSLSDEANIDNIDNPACWYGLSFSEIIKYRSVLIRSEWTQKVKERTSFLNRVHEVILSTKHIDIEVNFKRAPQYKLVFSPTTQPMGPTAPLKNFRVCENPYIPKKVDEMIEEKERAAEVVGELFENGFDVYYLTRLLSSGILGKEKRIVPTRWSITAVDDMISKELISRIKTFPEISEYYIFSSEYLHNHFEILLLPGAWEFEVFEAWAPNTIWTNELQILEEWEGYKGRKEYAEKEGGGYYAGRLGVTEGLVRMRKQAKAIIFREIGEGYVIPVGVWEVRENVREAFRRKGKKFETLKEALAYLNENLRIPIKEYIKRSQIIGQKRLVDD